VAEHPLASNSLDHHLPRDVALASARLILTRWAAGALVISLTALAARLLRVPLPEGPLYLTGAAILFYNACLAWLARRIHRDASVAQLRHLQRFVVLQVVLDWLSMSVFLHLTGGITSPAIPIFVIHMVMVTILLPGPSPYIYATLGTGALVIIAGLESAHVVQHYTVIPTLSPALYRDPIYAGAQVAFFAIVAFATVHLVALVMSRVRETERQVTALLQTSQAVSSTLSLPDVLQHLARSAAIALQVHRASIRVLDETGENIPMLAAYGLSEAYQNKGLVRLSRSPLDREAMAGQAVVVHDAPRDPRIQFPNEVAAEGIGSILVVPITGRSRTLGVLRVYAEQPDRFNQADADFVLAIARQGAIAIENAMAHEALQNADRARALFVRTVTHELRAPVSGAQSLLRVLVRGMTGELTPQQREILDRVEARLENLTELIHDLLALAASKTTEFQEPLRAIPLQEAVQHAIDLAAQEAGEKQIRLSYEAPSETILVRATPDGLGQIFGNLVGNAVKYTPQGGRVTVQVARQPPGVLVTVADTGMGIPAEDLPHLWEEFFRAGNAKRSGIAGTGLGLSIVKRLVETYEGMISVQSAEGKGTTFIVSLPFATP
jgi:signal transduction histidine kinase